MQHPSAVPVPPVKQGCCLPLCRGRGQCQSRSTRGGVIPTREEEEEKMEGEKMQANPAYLPIEMSYKSQESKSTSMYQVEVYVYSDMTCTTCMCVYIIV